MSRSVLVFLALLLVSSAGRALELTPTEQRWLRGIWPVVAFAKQSRLPLDIVVQPQPTPGLPPLALAFVDQRCKLVLSMRGNDEAQATLQRIDAELLDAALELMAAHELGHCRRYLDGAWFGLPAGFSPAETAEPPSARTTRQAKRREEGYGDLVGLAWTQQHHPALYARLHAWLVEERTNDRVPGGAHDTLAWVRLARHGSALAHPSIFAAASVLWRAGLVSSD